MEIILSVAAQKAIYRSNKRALIREKIAILARDPDSISGNVTKLVSRPGYRLRVQDWRVIFRIVDDKLYIDTVAPRGSAYEVG